MSKITEMRELPETALLRVKQVLLFVPVSRSNWWAGVKAGRFPKPLKLSERVTCWRAADIRTLISGGQPMTPREELNRRALLNSLYERSEDGTED